MKKKIKFFFMVFFVFLVLELILHLVAFFRLEPYSFADYMDHLEAFPVEEKNVVYFVGDSTIYGLGTNEREKKSLPARFEEHVKKIIPDFRAINLGYPSTCTEDHLLVLEKLPAGSTVFYRGGMIDGLNRNGHYRFLFFGRVIELRVWKMFSMLFYRFLPGFSNLRINAIRRKFINIQSGKNHVIYALDYNFICSPDNPFYAESGYKRIKLFDFFKENNLVDGSGVKAELMADGLHYNARGYYLESLFLFNYLCEKKFLALNNSHRLPLNIPKTIDSNMFKRYQELKIKLKSFVPMSGFSNYVYQKRSMDEFLSEMFIIAESLQVLPNDPYNLRTEYLMLEKLQMLVFHNARPALNFFTKTQGRNLQREKLLKEDLHKIEMLAFSLKAILSPNQNDQWMLKRIATIMDIEDKINKVSYIGNRLNSPYPLSFCRRFIRESGLTMEQIFTSKEWEFFFDIPYENFNAYSFGICK